MGGAIRTSRLVRTGPSPGSRREGAESRLRRPVRGPNSGRRVHIPVDNSASVCIDDIIQSTRNFVGNTFLSCISASNGRIISVARKRRSNEFLNGICGTLSGVSRFREGNQVPGWRWLFGAVAIGGGRSCRKARWIAGWEVRLRPTPGSPRGCAVRRATTWTGTVPQGMETGSARRRRFLGNANQGPKTRCRWRRRPAAEGDSPLVGLCRDAADGGSFPGRSSRSEVGLVPPCLRDKELDRLQRRQECPARTRSDGR